MCSGSERTTAFTPKFSAGSSSTEKEHFHPRSGTFLGLFSRARAPDRLISIAGICSLTGYTSLFPVSQNTAADAKYSRRCQETRGPFTERSFKAGPQRRREE